MALITKPNTFSAGAIIVAAEHNSNFDTIYNDYNGNITNANLAAGAAIVGSKLDLSAPGNIGATTPGTGKFTNLTTTSYISCGYSFISTSHMTVGSYLSVSGHTTVGSYLSVSGQPSVCYELSGNQTIVRNAEQQVYFNTPIWHTGMVYNAATTTLSASFAGTYFVDLQINWDIQNDSYKIYIYKAGNIVYRNWNVNNASVLEVVNRVSGVLQLAVGDSIQAYVRHDNVASRTLYGGGAVHQQCSLTITKLF